MGFSRGGTNLVLNLLRSHPDVCSPRGETHEVFRGKPSEPRGVRLAKRLRALPIRLLQGGDPFDAGDWTPRGPWHPLTRICVDRVLHGEKLRALGDGQNRWKSEGAPYARREIAAARLLCKNVNGLVLLSRELARTWPDATFVALVRDGRAVCEGHARRGLDVAEAARRYELGCRTIAEDAERIPRFHVFRYEDVVASPRESLEDLYEAAELDVARVAKIRLETKAVIDASGAHVDVLGGGEKRLVWYDVDDFADHFRPDANANQIARLSDAEKERITDVCGWSLRRFGYL